MNRYANNFLGVLHHAVPLPRTESRARLGRILPTIDLETTMFFSVLIHSKMSKERYKKVTDNNKATPHNVLGFLAHYAKYKDMTEALKYLAVYEYQVAIAVLSNTFQTPEVLGGMSRMYSIQDVGTYVARQATPMFYVKHGAPFQYKIHKVINNITMLESLYPTTRTMKDYLEGAGVIPIEFFAFTSRTPNVEGMYVTVFSVHAYSTRYVDYIHTEVPALDWVVDDAYETIGVTYTFNEKVYQCLCDIPKSKSLDTIRIDVSHTKRNTVKASKIVHS